MPDDSGAFKTNSANLRQIRAFCDALQAGLTGLTKRFRQACGLKSRRFVTNAGNTLRYPACSLIRGGEAAHSVFTAFPSASKSPCRHAGRVELAFMLPGF